MWGDRKMKVTKSKQEKPLYDGKARITKCDDDVLFSQNRSTAADNRISTVSVCLTREELLEALRVAGNHELFNSDISARGWLPSFTGGEGGNGVSVDLITKHDLLKKQTIIEKVNGWFNSLVRFKK
jgi:sulfur transfer complex TusBCD TusB component (DsrH family)